MEKNGSSHKRMLSILDLYQPPGHPALTAEQIMAALQLSRGTAYRYIRELVDAGLISRIGVAYTLGPRIIEMDHYIREFDPILRAAREPVEALRQKFECGVLVASYFSGRLVVSHHQPGSENISHGRGKAMPLFRGAGGKAILASLPLRRQKRLFEQHASEIARSGLAQDWDEFRATLQAIRRAGYAMSYGELDQGNVGIGAAIVHDDEHTPPSCLCLLFSERRYAVLDKTVLVESFRRALGQIADNLAASGAASGSTAGSGRTVQTGHALERIAAAA